MPTAEFLTFHPHHYSFERNVPNDLLFGFKLIIVQAMTNSIHNEAHAQTKLHTPYP